METRPNGTPIGTDDRPQPLGGSGIHPHPPDRVASAPPDADPIRLVAARSSATFRRSRSPAGGYGQ
ncbi:MAG: hypothetical protein HQ582_31065 [Planctomycetes bacterium]|nr:hypothetical protein [Planctomycetota bacterium]